MKFIGTKIVTAEAMTRLAYNTLRGWTVPADENPADDGYLVEYQDGGKPNVPGRAGYVSWSPKEQFENAYRSCDAMTFGLAIEALKKGYAIARAGWNGRGMFVYLVAANAYPASTSTARAYFGEQLVPYNAYLAIKGTDGRVSTWVPSVGDTLAEDYMLIDTEHLYAMLGADPTPAPVLSDILQGSQVHPSMAKPSLPQEPYCIALHADGTTTDLTHLMGKDSMDQVQLQALGKLQASIAQPQVGGPRVPPETVDALVASLTYDTARVPNTNTNVATARLPWGFVVCVGENHCLSSQDYDPELGRKYAIEAATLLAREKIWEFEGYSLAKTLASTAVNPTSARELAKANLVADGRLPHQVRVFEEKWDLDERLQRLQAFLVTSAFQRLDEAEQARLSKQACIMLQLSEVLAERIAAF